MAYGKETYAQQPYGGQSLDGTAPSLVSVDPVVGTRNVALNATVSFDVTAPDGLDPYGITVWLDGLQAMSSGGFLSGYNGSIEFTDTDCIVSISTHPNFSSGTVTIQISATSLAGITSVLSSTFQTIATADVAETDSLTESLDLSQTLGLGLTETAAVTENLSLGINQATGVDETVTTSASATEAVALVLSPSETVASAAGVGAQQSATLTEAESVTSDAVVSTGVGKGAPVAETVTIADSATSKLGVSVLPAEVLTTSEGFALRQHGQAGVLESVSLTDSATGNRSTSVDVGESIASSEAAQARSGAHPSADVTVVQGETLETTQGFDEGVTDTVPVIEGLVVRDQIVLRETVTINMSLYTGLTLAAGFDITVPFVESSLISVGSVRDVSETILVADSVTRNPSAQARIHEYVPLEESLTVGGEGISPTDCALRVLFTTYVIPDGLKDFANYSIQAITGVPIFVTDISPITTTFQSGTGGRVTGGHTIVFPDASLPIIVGHYLDLGDGTPTRIVSVTGPTVTTDRYLPPYVTPITWAEVAYVGVLLTTTRATDDRLYQLNVRNLRDVGGIPLAFTQEFTAVAAKPRLTAVESLGDGQLLLTFSTEMRTDPALTSPNEYRVLGTPAVAVQRVTPASPTQVHLQTMGMGAGDYTVEVNAHGTPHDVAGNPIDPVFNAAIFTGSLPLTSRSIFTDKGPISKPTLVIASGTGVVVESANTVVLTGASVLPAHVGLYVRLTGSSLTNDGTFRIAARLSSERVRLVASLSIPDTGTLTWQLIDERNGQIADDPSDVTVLVNGSPVTPEAVIGLLGQVVLPAAPAHGSDVMVDYGWVPNPTVEFRRLNSKEFRLNCWNRDQGVEATHKYRYNTTMVQPGEFNPLDPRALLAQPLYREMHYRGLERAYTAALNDPNLLLLNSPAHHIAYPPMTRHLANLFVPYEALTLPEADATYPWERVGTGTASVAAGILTIVDDSSGIFPTGKPIFWRRDLDLTFPAVFAASWRMTLDLATEPDGVFTGVAAGYSDEQKAAIIGYILDGTTLKLGILTDPTNPTSIDSWTGGLTPGGAPTGAPVEVDWSIQHSYRVLRDRDKTVRVYIDGGISAILQVTESDLPFLEELEEPFNAVQGVFFGALSRPARSTSSWDFIRYLVLPTNPQQSMPSIYVNYEATQIPEISTNPWTPIGSHGTETIVGSDFLLLDSTSATSADAGLVSGDFRGFLRLEPLLAASTDDVIDVRVQVRTHTHGITPDAVMAAYDDGDKLIQLCFFPDQAAPKFSYGGRTLPPDFAPYVWKSLGTATAAMVGQTLRIMDSTTTTGRVYYIEDTGAPGTSSRVIDGTSDYTYEFRCKVLSYTAETGPDPKFAGVFSQVYDGARLVGLMFVEVAGVHMLALHSDGVVKATLSYAWDGQPHTYRVAKSTSGNLVSVFVDSVFIGSLAYSSFDAPAAPDPVGVYSFGSATPSSVGAISTVDWSYANVWRTLSSVRRYAGLWRGYDPNSLTGYTLPLKSSGRGANISANALGLTGAQFITKGVVAGDVLVIDVGPNKGVYEIAAVVSQSALTIIGTFPDQPSLVDFRIPKETDWTLPNQYRIVRAPTGDVGVYMQAYIYDPIQGWVLDSAPVLMFDTSYGELPASSAGIVRKLGAGIPAIAFGAFDPTNLSQTSWDYVRYGITRSPTELRIVPHHELLNQWNVIASPEHLYTDTPHDHTGYMSCSTGIPPSKAPDFLRDAGLVAFTMLNDDTPLVPQTQSYEVRRPTPVITPVSALNRIEDVLNSDPDFVLNDARNRVELIVPDDVLYNCLEIIEQDTGEAHLVKPFDDDGGLGWGTFTYAGMTCLNYPADALPENTESSTPWELVSGDPTQVTRTVSSGILTYSIGSIGTTSVYRNATPLPDAPGLDTTASFRIRVLNDTTMGFGDSQIRVGLSFPDVTAGLAFMTSPMGVRFVLVIDLHTGEAVGSIPFDFLDGNFHTYRMVKDVKTASLQVFID
jgi:hypothetical protein